MDYLLRGILIGLLFGLPVGAVGTMTEFSFRSMNEYSEPFYVCSVQSFYYGLSLIKQQSFK